MKFVGPTMLKLVCSLSGNCEGFGVGSCLSMVISCQLVGSKKGLIPFQTLASISVTSLLLRQSDKRKLEMGAIVIHNGSLAAICAAGAPVNSRRVKEPEQKTSPWLWRTGLPSFVFPTWSGSATTRSWIAADILPEVCLFSILFPRPSQDRSNAC